MSQGSRLLVVEDDELIGTMVTVNLESHGHEVRWVRSGEDALLQFGRERFDLVLLDLMLPGADGLAVAEQLRRRGVGTPILMVTVRDDVRTKVAALEGGIDDYLTKPFDMDELAARVRALVRRGRAAGEPPASAGLAVAGGELDLLARRFRGRDGASREVGEKEAALLSLFARHPGRMLTRSDLIDEVWGMDALPSERTVDNFILRLRRLVGDDATHPRHLVTVRGAGYRYDP